jgi:hypothetical protein
MTLISLSNAGTFNAGSALTVSGGFGNTGTFNAGTGTVTFNGSGTQSVSPGASILNNVVHSGTGTMALNGNIAISGTLTNSAGTFNSNAKTMSVAGLTTISGGTYQPSTATQTLTGGLTLSGGTITQSTGAITLRDDMTVSSGTTFTKNASGLLKFASGTTDQQLTSGGKDLGNIQISANSGNTTLTLQDNLNADNITIDANQTLSADDTEADRNINCGGTWTGTGFVPATGTVNFDGAGAQTIPVLNYYNLALNSSGTATLTSDLHTVNGNLTVSSGTPDASASSLDVNGNVVVTSGTLKAPASLTDTAFTVSGNWEVSGSGVFTPGLGRVVLDGTATNKTIVTTSSGADDFYDLKINDVGSWIVSDSLEVNKNLTITSGTIDFNGKTITVVKNMLMDTASQVISDADAMDGTVLNITGRLDLTGQSSDKLIFKWTSPWTLNVGRNASLNYVSFIPSSTDSMVFKVSAGTAIAQHTDVARSNALTGISVYAGDGTSTDNDNNSNWLFSGPAPVPASFMFGGNIRLYGGLRVR